MAGIWRRNDRAKPVGFCENPAAAGGFQAGPAGERKREGWPVFWDRSRPLWWPAAATVAAGRNRQGRSRAGEEREREGKRERENQKNSPSIAFNPNFSRFSEVSGLVLTRNRACRVSTNSYRRAGRNGTTRSAKNLPELKTTFSPLFKTIKY